jgi:hypothetical protein
MFNQVVGSGADAFLIIFACIIAFAAALGYVDFNRQKDKQGEDMPE